MGDYERRAVHGTNPQLLIEKILRERIYESVYWKERLFASSAETLVDRAVELTSIGGQFGNQRPTEFVCLALKLLQLQPEDEIIDLFLNDGDFKYLTALAAFYVRLTAKDVDVYRRLEPLLLDKRKLRRRTPAGSFELTFMDQFVDELLTADRACDTILPRLARRSVLEDRGDLEPRVSPIEDELDELEGSEEGEVGDADDAGSGTGTGNVGSGAAKASSGPASGAADDTASKKRGAWSRKKVDSLFKKPAGGSKSDRRGEHADSSGSGGGGGAGGGAGDSLSVEETNRIRASLGLAPLKM
nr:hypothetical protein HK105_007783 [Polyrhizophydium stewartii]